MLAKYKIGDTLTVNEMYLKFSKKYLDKPYKKNKFKGKVVDVCKYNNHLRGNMWADDIRDSEIMYVFKNSVCLAECFLREV